MQPELVIPALPTLTLGIAVSLVGAMLNARIGFLRSFNIPEPVTGGLLAALMALAVYLMTGFSLEFDLGVRDYLLVMFFAGIGLNARFSDLLEGGKPLAILLVLTLVTIVLQNIVGVGGAYLFGLPEKAGVLLGSAALIGGHGTAIAWAPEVGEVSGMAGAAELGVATATLGLVLAALVGGPIAKLLIERNNLEPRRPDETQTIGIAQDDKKAQIDHLSFMRSLFYLNLSIILGYLLNEVIEDTGLKLPLFVPCMLMAIIVGNLRSVLAPKAPAVTGTRSLALLSEFALGAFLSMSLMSLQLWTIAGLGGTILLILAAQTLMALAFVRFVLFPLMGGQYRAAVLSAGFAGFALGATPTAIANMTAVTKRYGPSPIAFIVLPLVSAFFVDIANAFVIQAIVNF